jgi:hypothetical protein
VSAPKHMTERSQARRAARKAAKQANWAEYARARDARRAANGSFGRAKDTEATNFGTPSWLTSGARTPKAA